jgi:phage baseplate assembly protein W
LAATFRRKRTVLLSEGDANIKNAKPIGVTIPFNNPSGIFFQSYTNRIQVFSNLKNLLMTAKGERYMLPDFGTELKFILFENITTEEDFLDRIDGTIRDAISTWMPYILIENLEVKLNLSEDGRVDEPDHAIGISLSVKISGTNIYLPIQIFISTTGNLQIEEALYNG